MHTRVHPDLVIRPFDPADMPRLQAIREAAFTPIFAAFRAMLGEDLYALAQARDDQNQSALLDALAAPDSGWSVFVADRSGETVGFVSTQCDPDTLMGEVGLNAVDPAHAGHGIGTAMYDFAVAHLKSSGMRVATVSTGGDPSHAPARRAYQKAGFTSHIPSVWMCRLL